MTWSVLIDVFVAFFNAVTSIMTSEYLYSIFSRKNEKNKWLIPVCFVLFFLSPLVFGRTVVNSILLLLIPFAVAFKYSFKIYNKVLFAIIFVVISSVSEVVTQIILSFAFDTDTQSVIYENEVYFVTGVVLSKLLCFVIFFVIGAFKNKALVGKFSVKWLPLYSLPIATLLICYALFHSTMMLGADDWIVYLALVGMLLLGLSNFMIFRLVNNIHRQTVNEQRLEMSEELVKQQESRYSLLFENNEKLAKQRHDYKNLILGLASQLKHGEYEEVKERIDKELEALSTLSDNVTGNSVVDTLMGYKTAEAKACGVDVTFEHRNISSINISGVDLAVLLGNAIDNAVEAASGLAGSDKKTVDVIAVVNNGRLIITVSNYVKENIDVSNLMTTKSDAHLHGFGVINMRAVAEKYNGEVVLECREKVFKAIISVDNGI